MKMEKFSINATARSYPNLPYETMKDNILGKEYCLSLVFVGSARAKKLNQQLRNKHYTPNVLSVPLADDVGEIFIAPVVAKKEAPKFDMSNTNYVGFLFIHALLHLKGMDHGATMEEAERKYIRKYLDA